MDKFCTVTEKGRWVEKSFGGHDMKIALSASTAFGDLGWYVEKNLTALGHQVVPIFVGGHEHPSIWRHRFLRIPLINSPLLKIINKRFVDQVYQTKPDLLLVCKGEFIFPESLKQIRKKGIFTTNLYPDGLDELGRSFLTECLPHYDIFFTKEPYLIEKYGGGTTSNLYYLPQCCDSAVHSTHSLSEAEHKQYSAELGLVGSLYLSRYQLLKELSDYPMKIWGNDFVKLKRNDPLCAYHQGREVKGIEQAKVFSSTKINLNPHHRQDIYGVNKRTYEIAGSGGFQLVSNQRDLGNQFTLGEEMIAYDDMNDLKKKIDYYLVHDKERKEIARKAHARAHRDHTYQVRLSQMINYIKQR